MQYLKRKMRNKGYKRKFKKPLVWVSPNMAFEKTQKEARKAVEMTEYWET